ncbi:MAG: hypothetical protein R6V10_14375, partial [bacterium]
TTARREEPPPVRQPEPEPETRQPKPSRTTEPAPAPEPSREPRSTPTPSPPARSGSANLTVKIRGPIVETAKEPRRNAHINIILDGKHVRTVRPTRTKEDKNRNTGEVTAITYFWENVSVSFKNLDPGWHIVQIDTSLEDPSSHRAAMLSSSGQVNNDYNGQIDLKAGRTSTMVFTTKNWNTGQLIRSR